ncbi:glycoside hydrolase [Clostridia bacterium]|nr:glycoside hydrolase [Clostridia bacterium]
MTAGYAEKPLCFWGWNDDIRDAELIEQLRGFKAAGIGGVLVHSRAGLKIEYMGERWFAAFGTTVEECGRLGLEVWIYDEDGWPSGFAGGRVFRKDKDFVQSFLLCKTGDASRDAAEIVGVYDPRTLALLWREGDTEPPPQGENLIVYKEYNPVYVDILNKDAIAYFIAVTHEEYKKRFGKYFGGVIKGIFTDEPHASPRGLPWGKYVPAAFQERFGRDIYGALPYLFREAEGYRGHRYRFWKNVAAMAAESYAKPYFDWCAANGLIFTGHYACEEGLIDQIATSGGVMPLYEYQQMIGVDSLGNRLVPANTFKQAESVAWQLGNRKLLCETYACSGYDATFADILWIWGWQASMGVNVPCLSISMYSVVGTRKRDYPNFFCYQMPWWGSFPKLADAFNLVNGRLIRGERADGVLVISPKSGVWCERGAGYNVREKAISGALRRVTEALIDLQIDFDFGDEDLMAKYARVENGKIIVGKRTYAAVIVPPTVSIERTTADILRAFAESGGPVFVAEREPELIGGQAAGKVFDFEFHDMTIRADLMRKIFNIVRFPRAFEFIDKVSFRTAFGFATAARREGGELLIFAVNVNKSEGREVLLRVKGKKKLTATDLTGGSAELAATYSAAEDCTFADVRFDPQQAWLIDCADGEPEARSPSPERVAYLNRFTTEWTENILVADKCRISADGAPYDGEDFAVRKTAAFYKKIAGGGKPVKLSMKYGFKAAFVPERLAMACEIFDGEAYVNGKRVSPSGWWTDKQFAKFDISGMVKRGLNTVELRKTVSPFKSAYDMDSVFQSITNVFSYPYDIENIYILGDFGTRPVCGAAERAPQCLWADAAGFEICKKPRITDIADVTAQGLFNFCGTVRATARLKAGPARNRRFVLTYDRPDFTAGTLYINGQEVREMCIPPYRIDMTDFLVAGGNTIEIRMTSGARNLFGPFHHIKGRHPYVGHTVFKGYVEFEDFVVFPELKGSTWTDKYAVVPFGLRNIKITEYAVTDTVQTGKKERK